MSVSGDSYASSFDSNQDLVNDLVANLPSKEIDPVEEEYLKNNTSLLDDSDLNNNKVKNSQKNSPRGPPKKTQSKKILDKRERRNHSAEYPKSLRKDERSREHSTMTNISQGPKYASSSNNSFLSGPGQKHRFPSNQSMISTATHVVRKTYDSKTGLMVPIGGANNSQSMIKPHSQTIVADRVASARKKKQHELVSQNVLLAQTTDEQKREISILKSILKRQENSLHKYESIEQDLPRLLNQHAEQRRVDKISLRKIKEKERNLESKVLALNKDLTSKELRIDRMRKIVEDKSLRDAESLKNRLETIEKDHQILQKSYGTVEKKYKLETNALERQLKSEKQRSSQLIKQIEHYQSINSDLNSKLKANERALNDMNLYKANKQAALSTSNSNTNKSPNNQISNTTSRYISPSNKKNSPRKPVAQLTPNSRVNAKLDAIKSPSGSIGNKSGRTSRASRVSKSPMPVKEEQTQILESELEQTASLEISQPENLKEAIENNEVRMQQLFKRETTTPKSLEKAEKTRKLPVPPIIPLKETDSKLTVLTDITKKPGTAGTIGTSKWGDNETNLSTPRKGTAEIKTTPRKEKIIVDAPLPPQQSTFVKEITEISLAKSKSPTIDDFLSDIPSLSSRRNTEKSIENNILSAQRNIADKILSQQDSGKDSFEQTSITPEKTNQSKSRSSTPELDEIHRVVRKPSVSKIPIISSPANITKLPNQTTKTSNSQFSQILEFDNPASITNSRKNSNASGSSNRDSFGINPAEKKVYNFSQEVDNMYRGLPAQGALGGKSKSDRQNSFEEIFMSKPGVVNRKKHKPPQLQVKNRTNSNSPSSGHFYSNGDKEQMPLPSKKVMSPRGEALSPLPNTSQNFSNAPNVAHQSPSQHQMEQFLSRLEKYNIGGENNENILEGSDPTVIGVIAH